MKIKTNAIETRTASAAKTYKEIANAAGITERTLKQARDGAEIRPATAGRIAAALGVSIENIIER